MTEKQRLSKSLGVFMVDHDPRNPFGPNYTYHDYMTKVTHKHNLLMNYVNLTPEDESYKKSQQNLYLGTLAAGLFGGLAVAYLLRFGLKLLPTPKVHEFATKWKRYIYSFIVGIGGLEAYQYGNKEYNQNVCHKFLNKYLSEGVKNGFTDYKISDSKAMDFVHSPKDLVKKTP